MTPTSIALKITDQQHELIIKGRGQTLHGRIRVPGDKSISHRSLILGALAEGETIIHGLLLGEDPRSTAECFRAMGATTSELNAEEVRVNGIGLGNLREPGRCAQHGQLWDNHSANARNFSVASWQVFHGDGRSLDSFSSDVSCG